MDRKSYVEWCHFKLNDLKSRFQGLGSSDLNIGAFNMQRSLKCYCEVTASERDGRSK